MIAVDTNILARYYVDDPNDLEAVKQRSIARQVMVDSSAIFIPLSVILELEWVLRAFYGFGRADFIRVVEHLLGLTHVSIEQWPRLIDALALHREGLDFADALHLQASTHCQTFLSFDDRRFARRAARLKTEPPVQIPT